MPTPEPLSRHPAGSQALPRTSGKAILSLVLGIASLVLCGFLLGIPSMIVGLWARRDIRASGGRLEGTGLATAGFVTGLLGTVWTGLTVVLMLVSLRFTSLPTSSDPEGCRPVESSGAVTADSC